MIFSLQDSTLHCASRIQNLTARQWETQQVQTSYFRIPKFTAQLNTLLGREHIFCLKTVDFDGWAGSGSAGVVIRK